MDSKVERFKPYVAVYLILVNEHNEVCLLLRSDIKHIYYDKYTLISGHIDGNESVIDATIREAKEEANIIVKEEDLSFFKVVHRLEEKEYIDFYFICNEWEGSFSNNEPDKHAFIGFFNLDKLPNNMTEYIRDVLIRIMDDDDDHDDDYPGKYFELYGW